MIFGPYRALVHPDVCHDGDSVFLDVHLRKMRIPVKVDIDLGFNLRLRRGGLWLVRQNTRLAGTNAEEIGTAEGKLARDYLRTLIHAGDPVTLLSLGWDKFGGRIDGRVTLAKGADLAALMLESGHAKPWDGKGPRP